jgi:hypothetical protein
MKQTVSLQMDGGHIANNIVEQNHNSNGCAISSSYEKLVFSDLQEMLLKGKTLDEHYDSMLTTIGTSYKGLDKFAYGNVIKALQIIIESKIKHLRRCTKQKEAIAFLHQDVKFSPNLIQNMVNLFDVKLDISNILESSYKVFAERPQPKWLQNIESASSLR